MHLFQVSLFEKIAQFDVAMIQPPHFMAEIMDVVAQLEPDYADAILLAVGNFEMTIYDYLELYQTALR